MAKVDVISPGSEQTGNSVSLTNCDTTDKTKLIYMISPWNSSDGSWIGPWAPAGVSGSTLDITGWKDNYIENADWKMTSWKSIIVIQTDE